MKYAIFFVPEIIINLFQNGSVSFDVDKIYIICENPYRRVKNDSSIKYISINRAVDMYNLNLIDKFIIFPVKKKNLSWLYNSLVISGVSSGDILYYPNSQLLSNSLCISKLCNFIERNELDYLAIHISKKCNLCCAHCSAMSGLVRNDEFVSFEKTKDALIQLKRVVDSITYIQMIGGEPLLNDKIVEYCKLLRELFPFSFIEIVTNGTLLNHKEKDFFIALKSYRIGVSVSYYPILGDKIDEINTLLKNHSILYSISERVAFFEKYYNFSGDSDIHKTFANCHSISYCKNGLNLLENYLFPCIAPIALSRVGLIHKEDYGLNLSLNFDLNEIKAISESENDLCRFCHLDYNEKWRQLSLSDTVNYKNWSI